MNRLYCTALANGVHYFDQVSAFVALFRLHCLVYVLNFALSLSGSLPSRTKTSNYLNNHKAIIDIVLVVDLLCFFLCSLRAQFVRSMFLSIQILFTYLVIFVS